MSNKALQSIIEKENMFAGFRKEPTMDIDNLTVDDANKLYESIDCGLSPENLHCDGEITLAQARAKAHVYHSAINQLKKLGFPIPETCYEI